MMIARIDGSITSTVCHRSYKGWRLLVCQPLTPEGKEDGAALVAIDPLGAGNGCKVVVSADGKAARELLKDERSPARHVVVAIIDDEKPNSKPAA